MIHPQHPPSGATLHVRMQDGMMPASSRGLSARSDGVVFQTWRHWSNGGYLEGIKGTVETRLDIDYSWSRPGDNREMLNRKRGCKRWMLQMDNIIAVVSLTYSGKKTILSLVHSNLSWNGVVLHHMIRLSGNVAHTLNHSSSSHQLSDIDPFFSL